MKKIIFFFLVLNAAMVAKAQTADEQAVAAVVEKLRTAMIGADRATLESLAAADLSYGHSNGKIENKTSFVNNIVDGKSDFVSIALSDQTIHIADHTALVRHTFAAELNDGGKASSVRLGVLLIWQKRQGQWLLLARQAFKL